MLGPIDHGFCKSIYFAGLENMTLELSYSTAPIDADAWIDPEVVDLVGISPEELARFRHPADHQAEAPPRAQPGNDAPGPHMQGYAPEAYEKLMAIPDQVVLEKMSVTEPPVQVG